MTNIDPCWLPSAIMQTTAALLGLYAVVYVLTIERVGEYKGTILGTDEVVQQFKIGRKRKVDNALNQKRRNIFGAKTNCETASDVYTIFEFLDILDLFFIIILGSSIVTIFLNALWLENLSAKVFNLGFPYMGACAIGFFVGTLAVIFLYTLVMIWIRGRLRAFEREERNKHIETDAGGDLLKDHEGEIKD